MNKGFLYWLRWLAVLPVALTLALVVTLLIRQLLFYTLFVFLPLNNPVESNITPVLNTAGFIFFGSMIIPDRSRKALLLLFLLCLTLIGGFVVLHLSGATWRGYLLQFHGGPTSLLLAILGSCLGMSLVQSRIKHQQRQ